MLVAAGVVWVAGITAGSDGPPPGRSTGFVTVETDVHGVSWLQHRGRRFLSVGVNHVNNGGQDDGVGGRESRQCKHETGAAACGDTLSFSKLTHYAPYFNSTIDRWGSEQAWADSTTSRLDGWNFNTLGGWSCTAAEQHAASKGMYYAHLLDLGTTWLNHDGLDHDVWAPEFAAQCERIAAAEVLPRASDPWLLGWQLDNELDWSALGLAHFLAVTTAGRERAVAFVRQHYRAVAALNKAWGTNATSFAGLPSTLPAGTHLKPAFIADNKQFLGLVASRYFNTTVTAVKKYDPNHLILGMRGQNLAGGDGAAFLTAMEPWVDVFDWHTYSDSPEIFAMAAVANATNKPIIVGEWSFIAFDSNLPNQHGARSCGDVTQENCRSVSTTQGGRARGYKSFVEALMPQPWAVGFHWWQWADEPKGGRWPDGENSNYGLVHLTDDVYSVLTEQMTQTNAQVEAMHSGTYRWPCLSKQPAVPLRSADQTKCTRHPDTDTRFLKYRPAVTRALQSCWTEVVRASGQSTGPLPSLHYCRQPNATVSFSVSTQDTANAAVEVELVAKQGPDCGMISVAQVADGRGLAPSSQVIDTYSHAVDWEGIFTLGRVARGEAARFTLELLRERNPAASDGWVQIAAVQLREVRSPDTAPPLGGRQTLDKSR